MGIVDEHLSQLLSGDTSAEAGLMAIFDNLHIGIALFDKDLRYRYLNQTAQRVTRQFAQDPLGRTVQDTVSEAYDDVQVAYLVGIFRQVLATGRPHHQKAWSTAERKLERVEAYYDWSLYRVKSSERVMGLLLTLTEVTDHIRIQTALHKQEQLLRTVVDAVPGLLAYVDHDQRYVFANRSYRELLGVDPEQMVGRTVAEIAGNESYRLVQPLIEQALAGEAVSYERQLSFPGQPPRYMHGQYIPLFGSGGEVDGFIALIQDVGERRQMQERLERQNQELEQFAGLAAHDLQAPLRQALLQAELLGMDLEPQLSGDQRASLGQLREGLRRMQALVRALLAYARSGARDVAMGQVSLQESVEAALQNLAEQISEREAEVRVPDDLPTVHGERSLLTQVFQNLLSNGIKFCHDQPRLVIEYRAGAEHEIRIHDNGIGLAPEQLPQIFNSFKRLHGTSFPGTGLGLASCRKVVELHGGRIWAESRPDGGCTFAFTLPR